MEVISYNNELAYANILFANCFRNIQIERTLSKKKELLKVNCVFGQRSRVLKAIQNENRKAIYKLPLIAINRTSITRNPERLNNLHNEVKYQETSKRRNYNLMTPVPLDIGYDVTIYTKFPGDTDRILSNFLAFFNADIYVTAEHPKYKGIKFNNQIIFQDSITEEHPDEIDGSTDDLIATTCSFIFKTYIFCGVDKVNVGENVIPKISTLISTETVLSTDENGNEISVEVSSEISTQVDVIYDGFVPRVSGLHIGFYAVPLEKDFVPYINLVDTYEYYDPFVDRLIYKIDGVNIEDATENDVKVYRFDQLYPNTSASAVYATKTSS